MYCENIWKRQVGRLNILYIYKNIYSCMKNLHFFFIFNILTCNLVLYQDVIFFVLSVLRTFFMHDWAISLYIVKTICNNNRKLLFLLYFCFVLDRKFKAKWKIFFLAHAFSRWLCVSFLFHVCILFFL